MTTNTKVAVAVPAKENALAVFRTPNGLDPFLAKIREEIDGFIPDVTTRKGREAIASIAYKVAQSKTALDNVGKELVAELKEVPKLIDAERKRVRDTLDAWKDEVRKPLDEWEAAEAARVKKLQNGIDWFNLRAKENTDLDATELKAAIAEVERIHVGEKWEEFEAEAHRAKAATLESLTAQLAKREKHEAEQAELAKLRAEADARATKDREEQIAKEAADKARIEAEQKAQAESDAAAKRESDLKAQADQAERDRVAANERAEQAERDSAAKAEAAAQAERQRQADEQAELDRQAKARQADVEHKTKILKAAKEGLMKAGVSESEAVKALNAIRKGSIPNVTISF